MDPRENSGLTDIESCMYQLDKIMENIFTSCDKKNNGLVAASKLIEFIKPYMQDQHSALNKLSDMLDPNGTDRTISKRTFLDIMTAWTANLKNDSPESLKLQKENSTSSIDSDFGPLHTIPKETDSNHSFSLHQSISENNSFAFEKVHLEDQINELTYQNRKIMEDLEEVRSHLVASEEHNEILAKDLEKVTKRLLDQQVNAQLQMARKEMDEMRETTSANLQETQHLKKLLTESEKSIGELKQKVIDLETEKSTLEARIEELKTIKNKLNEKTENMQSELEFREQNITRSENLNVELAKQLEDYKERCQCYKTDYEALKEAKEDLESKLREHLSQTSVTSPEPQQRPQGHQPHLVRTPDRRGSFPFFKLCSPRPFNSPRLIKQLANPVTADWSPLNGCNSTPLQMSCDDIETSTPNNGEDHDASIYFTPSDQSFVQSPNPRTVKYVSDDEKGSLVESIHLYSSEEDVDWKMSLTSLTNRNDKTESLHSELLEATGCFCASHRCTEVLARMKMETESMKKATDGLEGNVHDLRAEVEGLKSQLSLKDDEAKLLIEMKAELEAKLARGKVQVRELKVRLEATEEVEQRCEVAEARIRELEDENRRKFIEIVDLRETVDALREELRELKIREEEMRRDVEEKRELKEQVQTLHSMILCIKNIQDEETILKQTEETKAFCHEYNTFLQTTMVSMSDSLTSLYQEKEKLTQQCLLYGIDVNIKTPDIEILKKKIEVQIKKNAKFAHLQEKKLELKDDQIRTLSRDQEEKMRTIQKLQTELETVNAQMIVKKEEMEELKSLVKIFQDNEELKAVSVAREFDKERASHREETKQLEEAIEKMKASSMQLQFDNDALKQNYQMLKCEKEAVLEELESVKERLRYFKELYNKAVADCEEILNEKNRIQMALPKSSQPSSRLHLTEENKLCEDLDLRAEKEALKEEREDWEKLRKTLTDKFSEDTSDMSSEISFCEVRSQCRISCRDSTGKIARSSFEKLQIKIERLQCQVDDQLRHLQKEKQRNIELQMRLDAVEHECSKEILMREVNNLEVRLLESNNKITDVLESLETGKAGNQASAATKQLLQRSPLASAFSCWSIYDRRFDNGEPAEGFVGAQREFSLWMLGGLKGAVDVTWMLAESLRVYGLEHRDELRVPIVSSSELTVPSSDRIHTFFMRPPQLVSRPTSPDSPSLTEEKASSEKIDVPSLSSLNEPIKSFLSSDQEANLQDAFLSQCREPSLAKLAQRPDTDLVPPHHLTGLYKEAVAVLSHFCVSAEQYGAARPDMLANLKLMHDQAVTLKQRLEERGLCAFSEEVKREGTMQTEECEMKRCLVGSERKRCLIKAPLLFARWTLGKLFTVVFTSLAIIGFLSVFLEICYITSGAGRLYRYPWSMMTWEEILAPFVTRTYNSELLPY